MRKSSFLLLTAAALFNLGSPGTLGASPSGECGGATPLIKLAQYSEISEPSLPLRKTRAAAVICRDSRVLLSDTEDAGGAFLFQARVLAGETPAESLNKLKQALVAAAIGFQQDCAIVPPASTVTETYSARITWYGRPPRQNTFTISSPPNPQLPLCEQPTQDAFAAIAEAIYSALPDSSTVILSAP